MDHSDEQANIRRVLEGDNSAFRVLVEKNKKMVYSIALRILNNAEDAEDAAQESFVKAYDQLHSFQGKSKFSTWLYTLTYRICLSKLNTNSIERTAIDIDLAEEHPDHANTPLVELTEREIKTLIKCAIRKLPKIEALLITLYYFDENSISDMEEITGLTASNIKVKLYRARKTLENELKFVI